LDNTKYGKYIISRPKVDQVFPAYEPKYNPGALRNVITLDDDVVKGAFTVHSNWFMPGENLGGAGAGKDTGQVKPHVHDDFNEVLCVFGSNPLDQYDLGAELEFWLGDEKHVITKSSVIFIPAGLQHGPIGFTWIKRPVFQLGIMKHNVE